MTEIFSNFRFSNSYITGTLSARSLKIAWRPVDRHCSASSERIASVRMQAVTGEEESSFLFSLFYWNLKFEYRSHCVVWGGKNISESIPSVALANKRYCRYDQSAINIILTSLLEQDGRWMKDVTRILWGTSPQWTEETGTTCHCPFLVHRVWWSPPTPRNPYMSFEAYN